MIRIAALDDMEEWLDTEEAITKKYFEEDEEEYVFCRYNNPNKLNL